MKRRSTEWVCGSEEERKKEKKRGGEKYKEKRKKNGYKGKVGCTLSLPRVCPYSHSLLSLSFTPFSLVVVVPLLSPHPFLFFSGRVIRRWQWRECDVTDTFSLWSSFCVCVCTRRSTLSQKGEASSWVACVNQKETREGRDFPLFGTVNEWPLWLTNTTTTTTFHSALFVCVPLASFLRPFFLWHGVSYE